jgi:predicted HTH transcriptional regulator
MNNIKQQIGLPENAVIEYKSAKGGLPASLWETYSSFANSNGGIIVLGIKEKNGLLTPDHLTDEQLASYKKAFWDIVHNRMKVSATLVSENDVTVEKWQGASILVINVPRARFDQRPVYLNHNPLGNTYIRRNEGDYLCSDEDVRIMFADAESQDHSFDSKILNGYKLEHLDIPTIQAYRNRFRWHNEGHPWSKLSDMEFLTKIGAYHVDIIKGEEGFTRAGIMMFGKTESITNPGCAPYFFPDLQEWNIIDHGERWSDRICPDGYWEANLYQFFNRAYSKLAQQLPVPFKLDGIQRVDETPAHKSVREALTNTLVHANYMLIGSIFIKIEPGRILMRNPGRMLVSVEEYYAGSRSKCRNPLLQTMFRLVGYGEKAGSGADIIARGWAENHWERPTISESLIPGETELVLNLQKMKEKMKETDDQNGGKKGDVQLTDRQRAILELIKENPKITLEEIANSIEASVPTASRETTWMQENKVIRRTTKNRYGEWVIVYDNL